MGAAKLPEDDEKLAEDRRRNLEPMSVLDAKLMAQPKRRLVSLSSKKKPKKLKKLSVADRSRIKIAAQEGEIALLKKQLELTSLKFSNAQRLLSDAVNREIEYKLQIARARGSSDRPLLHKR